MKQQIRNCHTYMLEDDNEVSFISRNDNKSKFNKIFIINIAKVNIITLNIITRNLVKKDSRNNNHYIYNNFSNNNYDKKTSSNKKCRFICNKKNIAFNYPFNPKNPNNKTKVIA